MTSGTDRSWWTGFFDDAAVFPPGDAPLSEAVSAYLSRLDQPWAPLVGPLLVRDAMLPELPALVEWSEAPLALSVVCSGGAGTLEPAAQWGVSTEGIELRSLELALRDLDDLPGSARRVTRAADAVAAAGIGVPVHVEVPPLPDDGRADRGWLAALDELAALDLRLKFRTGGPEGHLVPSPAALAAQIESALDREIAFKCTAGLHRAVRHSTPGGWAEHGFLNVLLATRASLDGEDPQAALVVTDVDEVVERVRSTGAGPLLRARQWFSSFGCCGVEDPYRDLLDLGLLTS